MQQRLSGTSRTAIAAVLAAGVLSMVAGAPATARAGEIHDYLADEMQRADAGAKLGIYVVFADRVPADELLALTAGLPRQERRRPVIERLESHAERTQARVRAMIDERVASGDAARVRTIWMGNMMALEATPAVIRELASFDEIEEIRYDAVQVGAADDPGPWPSAGPPPTDGTPLQDGLILLRADEAWALGHTGEGVVVANIDTGTDYTHPDLRDNVWINGPEDLNGDGRFTAADRNSIDDDGNGYVDDVLGYDFGDDDPDPMDGFGHGTSTAGQVVGDGTNGLRTGVAPGAKVMCLKPYDSGGSEAWIWEAMQYAVDNGADITTSSLSWKWTFSPQPHYAMWRELSDVEHAAGVLHTNSIGNQGNDSRFPVPYNVSAPGNSPPPWLHPDQTLVGRRSSTLGCGNVDAISDIITGSSGRGPSAWEDIQATHPGYPYDMPPIYRDYPYETAPGSLGLLKPDVSAPGQSTDSTTIGGGYGSFGGTSSATPHTAGTAALVLSADPSLTPEDVARILMLSSIEKGDPGKDIEYGAGRIDAFRAVQAATGALAPSVDSFSQTTIPMYAQTSITITGENFLDGTEVEFGGLDAVSVTLVDSGTLEVVTPVFPEWTTADVVVRHGLGETTAADAVEFAGDLRLNTTDINIGEIVNFTMRGPKNARWGFLINTELSSCVIKGLDFQVCRPGRLAISRDEVTNAVGSDFVNWLVPDDPGLVGEMLYIQAGIDGNGPVAGRPWRVTNYVEGLIGP